jgi:L-ascorbate metabolism protein UlaG (beta-lactamase superfamily)
MIIPFLQGEAFLRDVQQAREDNRHCHLWWLGQSGFLLHWQHRFLLLDPYLSDSLTRKYQHTDKPHLRMTERVIAPHQCDFVSVVTSSHNHTDHLDADTLIPLLKVNPDLQVIVPAANVEFAAQRLGVLATRLVGLNAGDRWRGAGFEIGAVPSAHEGVDRDDLGRHLYLGYLIRVGDWTFYHSGDTLLYPGMVERLRPWQVDVALLPINGRAPERRVAGNLTGSEAAQLAWDIGARLAVPCHYDMFEFNTATPDEFVATCRRLGQSNRVLHAGERWSSSALSPRTLPEPA